MVKILVDAKTFHFIIQEKKEEENNTTNVDILYNFIKTSTYKTSLSAIL